MFGRKRKKHKAQLNTEEQIEEIPFQDYQRTKPKDSVFRKILRTILSFFVIMALIGGFSSFFNKMEIPNEDKEAVVFFNKSYLVSLFSYSNDSAVNKQYIDFISKFSALKVTQPVITDNAVKSQVLSAETKKIDQEDNIYTSINKLSYTVTQSDTSTKQSTVYIKLVTQIKGTQFVVLNQPSFTNYEWDTIDETEKGSIQKEHDKQFKAEGTEIDSNQMSTYKQNLTIFFNTYSTDVEKARSLLPASSKLPQLSGGKFETEKLEIISSAKKAGGDDVLIVSVPYQSTTFKFNKIYNITYGNKNSITEVIEIV